MLSGAFFWIQRLAAPADAAGTSARTAVSEQTRARRYLVIMGICLGLLVLAWGVVRLWSVPLAVGMSMVAMVLPPIAAVVANHGWDRR
jgi:hypothetical protein